MAGFENHENIEETLSRELNQSLSVAFAQTVQELLPGYLPDKPRVELTQKELHLYEVVYLLLSNRVNEGSVEVIFEYQEYEESNKDAIVTLERITHPKFKLVDTGGKKEKEDDAVWNGEASADWNNALA